MTLKNKIITLKNLIEMWQMTRNDPKFYIKKSLDTLYFVVSLFKVSPALFSQVLFFMLRITSIYRGMYRNRWPIIVFGVSDGPGGS